MTTTTQPTPTSTSTSTLTSTSTPQAQSTQSQIDLLLAYHLHLWPALTTIITNSWGTSNPQIGSDKRAWLAGALSDLFSSNQLRDVEDLEDVLAQVMNDEFETIVDDGSLEEVAYRIWRDWEVVSKDLGGTRAEELLRELRGRWEERVLKEKRGGAGGMVRVEEREAVEGEWDGFEDEDEEGGVAVNGNGSGDVEMDDAPMLVDGRKKERIEPEVDEDGFTKVVGKKKR